MLHERAALLKARLNEAVGHFKRLLRRREQEEGAPPTPQGLLATVRLLEREQRGLWPPEPGRF